MHRRSMRVAVASLALAGLTLAACGSKTAETTTSAASSAASATSSSSDAGGALSIQPLLQVDKDGNKVEATTGGTPVDPAGDGKAKCSGISIAMAGALTGPNAALGQNILYGAKVAVKAHNDANKDCQVELKQFDTEGDPQKATGVAPTIVSDSSVIGLLGPAFSGETEATEPTFFQAGLLSLTASATRVSLTTNGWSNFFRGLGNDGVQGPAVGNYMVKTAGYKSVCIINDEQAYSTGLAEEIRNSLGDSENKDCASEVKSGGSDFASAVTAVKGASKADAIFYAGYYAEASKLVKQLRDGGVTIPFVSADGTNDPQFVAQAGSSSKGAILSCPCGPAPAEFAAAYKALNNSEPGVYSVEGYDLATIMLTGIDSGITDRAKMIDFVKNYNGQGLARTYKWDGTGELANALVWIYEVK